MPPAVRRCLAPVDELDEEDEVGDELPPRLLQALTLRDSGLSYDEIAQEMGVTKSTVASHLWYARRRGLIPEYDGRWARVARRERGL